MNIKNLRKKHIAKLSIAMKLKYNVIVAYVLTFLFFGTVGVLTTQAQGIFRAKINDQKVETTENTENTDNTQPGVSSSGSGLFRDGNGGWGTGDDDGNPKGKGKEREDDPDGDDDPIGEGILILSLLSGAYAIVKRNFKKKE